MNKLTILLLGLMAVTYFVAVSANEAEHPDLLESELSDEDDFDPDGDSKIKELWGNTDVLEDGVPNLVEAKSRPCKDMKSEALCKTCCESTGKSHKYSLRVSAFRLHTCTCFSRNNS